MNGCTDHFPRFEKNLTENRTNRIGKTDVANDPVAEEGVWSIFGLVDELVRDDHIAWVDRLLH